MTQNKGTRLAIAVTCSNELTQKLMNLRQRFRLSDGECASMLAGMLLILCVRSGVDPNAALQEAMDHANDPGPG